MATIFTIKPRLNQNKLCLKLVCLIFLINNEINHNSIFTKVLGFLWGKLKNGVNFMLKNSAALIYS